jgi:hypothetical protein
MARWKVNAKHYIRARQYGEPTEWVREETNRDTGRAFRKVYQVPLWIDPDDRLCCNREGICVLATEGKEHPGDITFLPPIVPTPDMEPLDDDAQSITDQYSSSWINPIDGMPSTGEEFGMQIMRALEAKINEINRPQAPVSMAGASSSEIDELKKMVAAQQAQINQLLRPAEAPKSDDVVLEDIDPETSMAPIPARPKAQPGRRV